MTDFKKVFFSVRIQCTPYLKLYKGFALCSNGDVRAVLNRLTLALSYPEKWIFQYHVFKAQETGDEIHTKILVRRITPLESTSDLNLFSSHSFFHSLYIFFGILLQQYSICLRNLNLMSSMSILLCANIVMLQLKIRLSITVTLRQNLV